MEQKKSSYTVEKLKTEQSYDRTIPLLAIYLEKTIIQDPFIPVFTAALFTIARTWKQPKCLSTEEWIKKYTHTMKYYSAIKRNQILPFAETWTDLETVIQRKVSQKENNKYHTISLTCGI